MKFGVGLSLNVFESVPSVQQRPQIPIIHKHHFFHSYFHSGDSSEHALLNYLPSVLNNFLLHDVYSIFDAAVCVSSVNDDVSSSRDSTGSEASHEEGMECLEYLENYIDLLHLRRRQMITPLQGYLADTILFPVDMSFHHGNMCYELYCTDDVAAGCVSDTYEEFERSTMIQTFSIVDILLGQTKQMINHTNLLGGRSHFSRQMPRSLFSSNYYIDAIRQYVSEIAVAEIAVVTAVYGGYESECKAFSKQSIAADFYCFTDQEDIKGRGWLRDSIPYALLGLRSEFEENVLNEVNAYHNNLASFNQAKYFKMNLHRIPLLSKYRIIVWIDGSIYLHNEHSLSTIAAVLSESDEKLMIFEHGQNGDLYSEFSSSLQSEKYKAKYLPREKTYQPHQPLQSQFEEYLRKGYSNSFWKQSDLKYHHRPQYGVFCTCFFAVRMYENSSSLAVGSFDSDVIAFFDSWASHNRLYSSQDQLSLPFVMQNQTFYVLPLPGAGIYGNFQYNDLFVKLPHDG